MNELVNPRAVLGDNSPPLSERLEIDEADLKAAAEAIAQRANELPRKVEGVTDEVLAVIGAVVRDAEAQSKTIEKRRVVVKRPWLEAAQTVDTFFGSISGRMDRIATAYTKFARDVRDDRRRVEAARHAEEQRKAQEAQRAADEAARKAREDAEAAAAKGRAATAALAKQRADELQAQADREAELARQREAQAAADAARAAVQPQAVKTELAPDLTMAVKGEWEGRLVDRTQVDWAVLGPHISLKEIEAAVKRAVKSGVRGCRGVEIKFVEDVKFLG